MPDGFDWLPDLICLDDYGGDWHRYCDALYAIFRYDFIQTRPLFQGQRVGVDRRQTHQNKEGTFWHCISEGPNEDDRTPDFRRCERIRWARKLIEEAESERVRWWRSPRPGQPRVVVALPDFSYIVVIVKRSSFWLLLTTHCVEFPSRREKLAKEYSEATEKG